MNANQGQQLYKLPFSFPHFDWKDNRHNVSVTWNWITSVFNRILWSQSQVPNVSSERIMKTTSCETNVFLWLFIIKTTLFTNGKCS